MIIGIQAQEEVRAAFLEQFDGGPDSQGLLLGLSALMHAVTNLLVADVLPKFAGKGTSSDAIPMEYVTQLFNESLHVGMNMQSLDTARYNVAVAMAAANLQSMFPLHPQEDESE